MIARKCFKEDAVRLIKERWENEKLFLWEEVIYHFSQIKSGHSIPNCIV